MRTQKLLLPLLYFSTFLCLAQEQPRKKVEAIGLNGLTVGYLSSYGELKIPLTIAPFVLIHTKQSTPTTLKLIQVGLSYTSMRGFRDSRMEQSLRSFHLKLGQQFISHRIVRGYFVELGNDRVESQIQITGNYFSDYINVLPTDNQIVGGLAGYFGTRHRITDALFLLWSIEGMANLGGAGRPTFPNTPGIGFRYPESNFSMSFRFSFSLLYHLPNKTR